MAHVSLSRAGTLQWPAHQELTLRPQDGGPEYTQTVHAFAKVMTLAAKAAALQQSAGNKALQSYLDGAPSALAALQAGPEPAPPCCSCRVSHCQCPGVWQHRAAGHQQASSCWHV